MNRHTKEEKIIKGYHGIMDLDLTDVDPKLHTALIEQHEKDIELYKTEQDNLPRKKRYENTVGYINKKLEVENYMRSIRMCNASTELTQQEKDDRIKKLYELIGKRPQL